MVAHSSPQERGQPTSGRRCGSSVPLHWDSPAGSEREREREREREGDEIPDQGRNSSS